MLAANDNCKRQNDVCVEIVTLFVTDFGRGDVVFLVHVVSHLLVNHLLFLGRSLRVCFLQGRLLI